MATPDEVTFAPEEATNINHNDAQQPTEPTTSELTNGDTSMVEEPPASPISRPAASPIHSPMNDSATDTHMNGTDEDMSDHPHQASAATDPLQAQQPEPAPSALVPDPAATPPAPQPLVHAQAPKEVPSPSPRSTPAPSVLSNAPAGTSTSASTRVAATTASVPEAIPSQMANNEHGSAARVYINTRITPTLLEGMKWVAKHEPEKPLKWLSEFLARRSAELEGT